MKATTRGGRRLLVSTSYGGGTIPRPNVARSADFLLLHGNGVAQPERIAEMVRDSRQVAGYAPMPILFNEDDHFDFDGAREQLRRRDLRARLVGLFRLPDEGRGRSTRATRACR